VCPKGCEIIETFAIGWEVLSVYISPSSQSHLRTAESTTWRGIVVDGITEGRNTAMIDALPIAILWK